MARMKAKLQADRSGNTPGRTPATNEASAGEGPSRTYNQGRRKRAAKKAQHPVFFTESESDEEVDLATYRQYKWECRRLRRENKQMQATASVHTSVVEKSLLVAGLRSEIRHLKGLLNEANVRMGKVQEELSQTKQTLLRREIWLEALRRGWQAKKMKR